MLIVQGTLLTFGAHNRIVQDGAIRIQDGLISDVSTTSDLRIRSSMRVEGSLCPA